MSRPDPHQEVGFLHLPPFVMSSSTNRFRNFKRQDLWEVGKYQSNARGEGREGTRGARGSEVHGSHCSAER